MRIDTSLRHPPITLGQYQAEQKRAKKKKVKKVRKKKVKKVCNCHPHDFVYTGCNCQQKEKIKKK